MRERHRTAIAVWALVIATEWTLCAIPLHWVVAELVVFAAPGAMFGVATAWVAHAIDREHFGWRTGLHAAIIGGAALPPLLGVGLALTMSYNAAHLVVVTTLGAWLALALALAFAPLLPATRRAVRSTGARLGAVHARWRTTRAAHGRAGHQSARVDRLTTPPRRTNG